MRKMMELADGNRNIIIIVHGIRYLRIGWMDG